MRFVRIPLVAVVAAALALSPSPSPGATSVVKAKGSAGDFRWDPDFRHITKGNKIRWKNTTNTTHHVKAYGGNWSIDRSISPGESTAKRFKKTGSFKYRCDIPGHSTLNGNDCNGMCAEIHVTN